MQILETIRATKVIAIARGLRPEHMLALARALHNGGIRAMEVTFNQAAPEKWRDTTDAIAALAREMGARMAVGAGTVLTVEQARLARDAGAAFIVSPNASENVIRETKRLGMRSFPGALTPTEAVFAHECGADMIKIFPAGQLGPGYIKALKAPLSHLEFIAVGGVSEKNGAEFLRSGAAALGVGGNLVNRAWIEAGEFEKITALAREYADL